MEARKSMRTIQIISVIMGLIAFMGVNTSYAQAPQENITPQFFALLNDVPVMPGLIEDEASAVMFDKPEGRIIEAYAYMDGITVQDVVAFYHGALPQFGWGAVEGNVYFRRSEYLELSFEGDEGKNRVKFMIKPSR